MHKAAYLLCLLTAAALAGCAQPPEPEAPKPMAAAGQYTLELQSYTADGSFQTSYDPGAGALPATVPAPLPGTYAFDGGLTGLPDLPAGLGYQGWLVQDGGLAGMHHMLAMDLFEGDSLGLRLQWTSDANRQDHPMTLVTLGPAEVGSAGIPVAVGHLEGVEVGSRYTLLQPFSQVAATAFVDDESLLHFDAQGLPESDAVSYALWALDLDMAWHLVGLAPGQAAFHLMSAAPLPALAELRLTVETLGAVLAAPSPFQVAKLPFDTESDGGHAGH